MSAAVPPTANIHGVLQPAASLLWLRPAARPFQRRHEPPRKASTSLRNTPEQEETNVWLLKSRAFCLSLLVCPHLRRTRHLSPSNGSLNILRADRKRLDPHRAQQGSHVVLTACVFCLCHTVGSTKHKTPFKHAPLDILPHAGRLSTNTP